MKSIDPAKIQFVETNLFFILDGAGVDDVHAKDGGQKLEIRSGKWLGVAI